MGRVKLAIKKIENLARRKITYSKRKNGLVKKAQELSILCDVDVAVIAFSSSGKTTHFCTEDRIDEVISRFARAKELERSKSSSENGLCVKKVCRPVTDEQGLEAARVAAVAREHETLRTLLRKAERDKDFFKETARLFAGAENISSGISPTQLAKKWEELFQLKLKVEERMRELEIQSGVQRTSFDDEMLRGISAQESTEGLSFGSTRDNAQPMLTDNWDMVSNLDNGTSIMANSQMREASGVQRTSFEDEMLRGISAQESTEGLSFGSTRDNAQAMHKHNWNMVSNLDNGTSIMDNSQMREPSGADYMGPYHESPGADYMGPYHESAVDVSAGLEGIFYHESALDMSAGLGGQFATRAAA